MDQGQHGEREPQQGGPARVLRSPARVPRVSTMQGPAAAWYPRTTYVRKGMGCTSFRSGSFSRTVPGACFSCAFGALIHDGLRLGCAH